MIKQEKGQSKGDKTSNVKQILNHTTYFAKGNDLGNRMSEIEDMLIIDVWAHNLHEEMKKIINILDEYPYIAMDTEFPGVVARPIGVNKRASDYNYKAMKVNVDLLNIIQIGFSMCDKNGNLPKGTCTWQFNFKFDLTKDMYAEDSIKFLKKSGIKFDLHQKNGIEINDFAEVMLTSGLVLNPEAKWLSFHSSYDFGYLLKILTGKHLPESEEEFFELFKIFWPIVYDLKHMMKSCDNLKGGLSQLAEDLKVQRIGPQHQAGSDSLLTAATFFKMKNVFFETALAVEKFSGTLFGLGNELGKKKKKVRRKF